MKSKEKLIDSFIEKLKFENYSENTLTNYKVDLNTILKFMGEFDIENFDDFTFVSAQNYSSYLSRADYSNISKNRKLSTVKTFFSFLQEEHDLKENYFSTIKSSKKPQRLPKFILSKEINELIDSIDKTTAKGIRDRAIIEMLYGLGIRVSELTNILLDDVSFYNETVLIKGKGNKERIVPMHSGVIKSLRDYLNYRNEFLTISKEIDNDFLFLNTKGTRLTSRGVRIILDNILDKASFKTKMTPHMFRHSFATDLLNNGADIRSVQELLGHVNLSSTQIYTGVNIEKIKESYMEKFPRKRGKK